MVGNFIVTFLTILGLSDCVWSSNVHKFVKESLEAGNALKETNGALLDTKTVDSKMTPFLACSHFCVKQAGCFFFATKDSTCKLYLIASPVAVPQATATDYYYLDPKSDGEVLLLHHDAPASGFFPLFSSHGSWALNKDDPSAAQFSRLDELELYVGEDGVYNFKLCYPNLTSKCFVFDQDNDPRTGANPVNFLLHSGPNSDEMGCGSNTFSTVFSGLVADTQAEAWLDGIVGFGFFYSVGSSNHWSELPDNHFPTASCTNGGPHPPGDVVDLYIIIK